MVAGMATEELPLAILARGARWGAVGSSKDAAQKEVLVLLGGCVFHLWALANWLRLSSPTVGMRLEEVWLGTRCSRASDASHAGVATSSAALRFFIG